MIKAAFNILYAQGYIARASFKGDEEQAFLAISARAEERKDKQEPVTGAVFFTHEAVKERGADGSYPIHFGNPKSEKYGKLGHDPLAIGVAVVRALTKAGTYCEWDGDPTHPVIVKEN